MSRETGSIDVAPIETAPIGTAPVGTQDPILPAPSPRSPLPIPQLLLSAILIALGAVAFSCVLAVLTVLVFYLRVGADGLTESYQELRFDYRLKTLVGTIVVSMLYAGTATATIIAATWRGGRNWPSLVGWTRVRSRRRLLPVIFSVTLIYAAVATFALASMRTNRVIVTGATDLALVGTITANLVLLAPIAEELFFRGWLYTGLRSRLSFWPSFVATATLFAAIHWDASHRRILLVLPLAVALGILREVTGSINPTIALHAVYNLVIIVITIVET